MTPIIKVCGIQNTLEAVTALSSGANTLGFLLGLTHKAEDKITPDMAKNIIAALPPETHSVMVTHLLDAQETADIARFAGTKSIQIHDEMPCEEIEKLRNLCPSHQLIKAVHVMGGLDEACDKVDQYENLVDFILLDSRTKERLGGTGLTIDWDIGRQIVEHACKPVILAGGLNHANVAQAIRDVAPFGVDANSGLEFGDGSKNPAKILGFATTSAELLPRISSQAPRFEKF